MIFAYLIIQTFNLKFYFMKRMMIFLMITIATARNMVSATGDDKVSSRAKHSFEREFPGAKYARWEKVDGQNVYLIRFVYNEQGLLSYIDEEGRVLATARSIEKEQLPFLVNETFNRKYSGFGITHIDELTTAANVSYMLTIENEYKTIYLRIYHNGSFEEIKNEKKKSPVAAIPM